MNIKHLNLNVLLQHQKKLDKEINKNSSTIPEFNKDLINAKILAFITEIGEFANERRVFKYWSKKEPASIQRQLEEYVDSMHFLLSISNQLDYQIEKWKYSVEPEQGSKNIKAILKVIEYAIIFINDVSQYNFRMLINEFLKLSVTFEFKASDIYDAYIQKHYVNIQRQKNNY